MVIHCFLIYIFSLFLIQPKGKVCTSVYYKDQEIFIYDLEANLVRNPVMNNKKNFHPDHFYSSWKPSLLCVDIHKSWLAIKRTRGENPLSLVVERIYFWKTCSSPLLMYCSWSNQQTMFFPVGIWLLNLSTPLWHLQQFGRILTKTFSSEYLQNRDLGSLGEIA